MRHDHDPLLCFHHRHLGYHLKLNLQKEVFNCARGISRLPRMGSMCVARKAGTTFETIRCFSASATNKLGCSALGCVRSPSSSTCYRESRRRALVKPSAVSPTLRGFAHFGGRS